MSAPVKKFRAGAICCALWENEINVGGQSRTMLKATVERRYKDKDGEWKSSGSFGRNEIPLAIYCLQQAFEAMLSPSEDEEREMAVEEVVIE
jgi:hypothetical protein